MNIVIEITPELEKQLRQAADKAGLAPDAYVVEALQEHLAQTQHQLGGVQRLSQTEADLLSKINTSLSQLEWERYHKLVARRKAESLTADEQMELIALSDRIEEANARRIEYLAELARVRNTTLDALIEELALKPSSRV